MATLRAKQIYKTLKYLFNEGEHIVCVRSPEKETGYMWTGYYNDFKKLALFLDEWDDGNIEACYICTNPADPSKVVVKNCMEKFQQSLKADEILYRYNLLIDIDTLKSSDIATEAEKEKSATIREMIIEFLLDQAFPEPLVAGSGNGWHLIYRLPNLVNDKENRALVERVQRYLKQNFSVDGVCKIDVFKDANRLTRVYGTYNRKGRKSAGQEYWQSGVIDYPDVMEPVRMDALKMVASLVPPLVEYKRAIVQAGDDSIEDWMMEEALDKYVEAGRFDGYDMVRDGVWNLYSCPWEFEHSTEVGNGTVQVSLIGGIPGFNDLRASCFSADDKGGGKRTWIDFRNKCDPDRALYKFPLEFEEIDDEELLEDVEMDVVSAEDPAPKKQENICFDDIDPRLIYAEQARVTIDDPSIQKAIKDNKELKEKEAKQEEAELAAPIESDTETLEMPEEAMYGKLGEYARDMKMQLGLAYPALIGVYSSLPETDVMNEDTRINQYVMLLTKVGGGKNEAMKRARAILKVPEDVVRVAAPVSDRGLMNLIGDKAATKRGEDRQPGMRKCLMMTNEARDVINKMAIQNSTLGSLLCDLWDENVKSVPDRQGVQSCDCRLSWVGGIPVDVNAPEEFSSLFGKEAAKGLVSRMIYGYSGKKFNYRPWKPTEVKVICEGLDLTDLEETNTMYNTKMTAEMWDRGDQWNPEGVEDIGRTKYLLYKVALLTANANGEYTVTDECMTAAIHFMKWQCKLKEVFKVGMATSSDEEAQFNEVLQSALEAKGACKKYVNWKRLMYDRKWQKKYKTRTITNAVEGLIKLGVLIPWEGEGENGRKTVKKNNVMLHPRVESKND